MQILHEFRIQESNIQIQNFKFGKSTTQMINEISNLLLIKRFSPKFQKPIKNSI